MDKIMPKAILLSGFTEDELKEFLKYYKQNKNLPRVIFATITKTALEWKVKDWLAELEKEDAHFKKLKEKPKE